MDDIQLIQFLANALKSATQQRDWVQVRNVDKQIASLLSSLSGQPLSEQKRQALMMLKDTHHRVNEICRQQSAELEHKMLCTVITAKGQSLMPPLAAMRTANNEHDGSGF